MRSRACILRALCVACLCTLACVKNPATGKHQLSLVSEKQEIEMGKEGAQAVASTIGLYEDAELQSYVQSLGERLVAVSERRDSPWTFRVADDPAVNAFALPGGFIFVTRGILAHLDNEAQLMAVMGHEVGHVTAQHSVEQVSREQLASVGLGVGSALSPEVRRFAGVGAMGLQLLFLKFGRDAERQADKLGLRYALAADYDPREMPKVFETLGRVSDQQEGGERLPAWLATHPDPEERVIKTEARIEELGRDLEGTTVAEGRLMQNIDGIIYGDNPRDGFFRGERFYHPELRFSFDFPEGWKAANGRQVVLAQSPEGDAALQLMAAGEKSPRATLSKFLEQSGAKAAGDIKRVGAAEAVPFVAKSESGEIAGVAAALSSQGHHYLIIGFSTAERYASYESALQKSIASFAKVSDKAVLEAKPARLRAGKLAEATALSALHAEHPGTSVEQLALLNQVEVSATLPKGHYAKWVEPGTPDVNLTSR